MHKYSGVIVRTILAQKKASIRDAPLPKGSPSWSEIEPLLWDYVDAAAKRNESGFKTVRKLLTDQRFDK